MRLEAERADLRLDSGLRGGVTVHEEDPPWIAGLARRERSLINLAMLTALNRSHELAVHVRGAINNGCTEAEIQETLLQTCVYCGVPAAMEAFRVADAALSEATLHAVAALARDPIACRTVLVGAGVGEPLPDDLIDVVHIADSAQRVAERYDAKPGTACLFRPDQHLCARWRAFNAATVRAAIARATGAGVSVATKETA